VGVRTLRRKVAEVEMKQKENGKEEEDEKE
jgi:hypothetical protein